MNKENNKLPTLKDIADKLGVSIVTVSNALSERVGVSEELRTKIKNTANEMGYQPKGHKIIQMDMEKTSRKIGVISDERYLSKYDSFYWAMYQKVAFEASCLGCFSILELLPAEKLQQKIMPRMVSEEKIDGLIILGPIKTEYLKYLYHNSDSPMIFMDFNDTFIPCDAVISNNYYGMYQMTNYLINNGHSKIAFVGNVQATESIMDRYMGYVCALMEHDIKENKDWIVSDRKVGRGNIHVMLEEKILNNMPTSFVCNCDYTANQLAGILNYEGYHVPQEISLVSYDDFLAYGKMKNRITTYSVDMDAMAHSAVNMLLKRIEHDKSYKKVKIVDGKIIVRKSVRDINNKNQ